MARPALQPPLAMRNEYSLSPTLPLQGMLVGVLMSNFSTNMAISETKGPKINEIPGPMTEHFYVMFDLICSSLRYCAKKQTDRKMP